MVSKQPLNVPVFLIVSACFIFFYPLLVLAQGSVTLSAVDGLGVRGSVYGNPNYPESNRVELSLDNPDDDVVVLTADICSSDLGDKLIYNTFDLTDRTIDRTFTVTENSGCLEVRSYLDLSHPITQGSGPILTLYFDVSTTAVNETYTDLSLGDVEIRNDSLVILTPTLNDGKFYYYSCGANQHCDDGLFCNGEETCFGGFWCVSSPLDSCPSPLTCNEGDDVCNCSDSADCNDGLYCNGEETCVGNLCVDGTPPCKDSDPCTDDCDEYGDTCLNTCNAAGPWDACCASSAVCASDDICSEVVTLTVGNLDIDPGDDDGEITVSLANPSHQVKAVQVDICDDDNYLICTYCDSTGRAAGLGCQINEQTNGCCKVTLADPYGGTTIGTGSDAPVFTLDVTVQGTRPYGHCRDLAVDRDTFSLLDSVTQPLVALPVDGEVCYLCTPGGGACWDGNPCTDDECNANGKCAYTNLTGSCNDGDDCTLGDQCKSSELGNHNVCMGEDPCPDMGVYCDGVDFCDGGACYDTGDPCSTSCSGDSCTGSDATLIVENAYGREGIINIVLENNYDEVSEVHLHVCDADQRDWLHIATNSCDVAERIGPFQCAISDLGLGCVEVDITSNFPLDHIGTGKGAIAQLNYTVDPVDIPLNLTLDNNYADLNPENIDVKDNSTPTPVSLTVTPKSGKLYAADYCYADFDDDGGVTSADTSVFLSEWNQRTIYSNPCTSMDPCFADFDCDGGVTSADVSVFLSEWNQRTIYSNPCPPQSSQFECEY